ncbi:hypothetical protein NDS46_30020 (plasmid) [Paenibacillus thiaminolyticus]|uniref:hypothetical protein n=1 Tax=Paenibacillus thiaminolyticus TaxID=49283 RepID=UPI00232FE0B3|nr:hypothetical protein [Paenibacillus thiaminolyticus]WCF11586.1 hypothetical protein NDS46_30020 [Paenibacillus thiaminolyticus]
MPNEKGWYSKEEVLETGLPYYIPASKRWTKEPYEFAVLLTKSRCKEFGVPILRNGHEKPSAFRYAAAAGTGTDDKTHRYFPLYDRTDVFKSGELDSKDLYEHEIMGKLFNEK